MANAPHFPWFVLISYSLWDHISVIVNFLKPNGVMNTQKEPDSLGFNIYIFLYSQDTNKLLRYPHLYHTEAKKVCLGPKELALDLVTSSGMSSLLLGTHSSASLYQCRPLFIQSLWRVICKCSSGNWVELESYGLHWEGWCGKLTLWCRLCFAVQREIFWGAT